MKEVETEVLYRVHYDRHFIEVGEDADGLGMIEIRTSGESAGYFGAVRLSITPEVAKHLGAALLNAAAPRAQS